MDQLLVDIMILKNCKRRSTGLGVACMTFKEDLNFEFQIRGGQN